MSSAEVFNSLQTQNIEQFLTATSFHTLNFDFSSPVELKNILEASTHAIQSYCAILLARGFVVAQMHVYLQRIEDSAQKLFILLETIFDKNDLPESQFNAHKLRHDACNHLNQIVGYVEILQDDPENLRNPELQSNLRKMCEISNQMIHILDRVARDPDADDTIG